MICLSDVVPFRKDLISDPILQKMLKQNIVVNFRFVDPCLPENFLYRSGKPSDCFIMLLQGRVEVEFGKENLSFEGGPFAYFGVNALIGTVMELMICVCSCVVMCQCGGCSCLLKVFFFAEQHC